MTEQPRQGEQWQRLFAMAGIEYVRRSEAEARITELREERDAAESAAGEAIANLVRVSRAEYERGKKEAETSPESPSQSSVGPERMSTRVAMAGEFWERGEPLTDEVLATREYLMRKFGRPDVSPPRVGWEMQLPLEEATESSPVEQNWCHLNHKAHEWLQMFTAGQPMEVNLARCKDCGIYDLYIRKLTGVGGLNGFPKFMAEVLPTSSRGEEENPGA